VKPTVGQEVIVIDGRSGDEYRGTVTKVARKYFTVEYRSQQDGSSENKDALPRWTPWPGSSREVGAGPWVVEFAIATGRERNTNPNYPNYAYTAEAYAAKQLRAGISRRLRCVHKLDFGYAGGFGVDGSRLSIEALDAILAILDAERDRLANE
jgi:hypothetical protein